LHCPRLISFHTSQCFTSRTPNISALLLKTNFTSLHIQTPKYLQHSSSLQLAECSIASFLAFLSLPLTKHQANVLFSVIPWAAVFSVWNVPTLGITRLRKRDSRTEGVVLAASMAIVVVFGQRACQGSHHTQFSTFGRWTRTVWVPAVSVT